MSDKYKINKGNEAYFVTFTTVGWIKILEEDSFKQLITDNIKFYQINKGLVVHAYCIMPNHVHMIIRASDPYSVSDILRDLKKFTSRAIIRKLEDEKSEGYKGILNHFREAGGHLKRIQKFKVWQDGNRAMILYSNMFLMQKLNYIHNNPVKSGFCFLPWEYKYSSAMDYTGQAGLVEVDLLTIVAE